MQHKFICVVYASFDTRNKILSKSHFFSHTHKQIYQKNQFTCTERLIDTLYWSLEKKNYIRTKGVALRTKIHIQRKQRHKIKTIFLIEANMKKTKIEKKITLALKRIKTRKRFAR